MILAGCKIIRRFTTAVIANAVASFACECWHVNCRFSLRHRRSPWSEIKCVWDGYQAGMIVAWHGRVTQETESQDGQSSKGISIEVASEHLSSFVMYVLHLYSRNLATVRQHLRYGRQVLEIFLLRMGTYWRGCNPGNSNPSSTKHLTWNRRIFKIWTNVYSPSHKIQVCTFVKVAHVISQAPKGCTCKHLPG